MRRRGVAAVVVLGLWTGGMVALIRQQYFQPNVERLAEAAMRVTPGAVFYAVLQGGQQIGFASSTIDTVTGGIRATDYLVANVPAGGAVHRIQARTTVRVSRTLRVRISAADSAGRPRRARGTSAHSRCRPSHPSGGSWKEDCESWAEKLFEVVSISGRLVRLRDRRWRSSRSIEGERP